MNELKYQLFEAKKGNMESCQLPPCTCFLYLHDLHANYCCMKKRSLEKYHNIPGCCGIIDSDQLSIDWLQGPPDLEIMLEFMASKCSKICKLPSCQCLMNNFKCQLQTYENMNQDVANANLSGMEGLDDHTEDAYPKWHVGSIVLISYAHKVTACTCPWYSQIIKFQMNCCTYV